ncbi:MAG: hypothetical protein V7603_3466 [Micromonosporaceae bacterium]|jgi:hypothetical protein
MGRLIPLLALADLAILVIALIDCLSVDEHAIRALPRVAWVFIILLFSPIGGIAWFIAGRPERDPSGRRQWRPGNGFPEAERPRQSPAPDDDPEFLRRIASRTQREDTELLRAWEADLRKREEELREQERKREQERRDGD